MDPLTGKKETKPNQKTTALWVSAEDRVTLPSSIRPEVPSHMGRGRAPAHVPGVTFTHSTSNAAAHIRMRCGLLVPCPKLSLSHGNRKQQAQGQAGAEVSEFGRRCLWGQARVKQGLQEHSPGLRCTDFPPVLF